MACTSRAPQASNLFPWLDSSEKHTVDEMEVKKPKIAAEPIPRLALLTASLVADTM
jgi:hypothetical protein